MVIDPEDEAVRGALTRLIATVGHAPSIEKLSEELGLPTTKVEERLQRLADGHALLLHPGTTRPWVVHPFALAPGSCWVATPTRGYWANCLYCGLGIAAALDCDATITTRYGGEADTVVYTVRNGSVEPAQDLFHLSTPPARWWDNVVFACSSFQPFRTEAEIARWCAEHDLPRGATMTIPQLWAFARDWYGDYLARPWRKRSSEDARAVFERNGLVGPFWMLALIVLAAVVACTPEAPQLVPAAPSAQSVAKTPPRVAVCLAATDPRLAKAMREDLDGDGKPDWIVEGSQDVEVFVDRNGCAEHRGVFETEGPLAFVHVSPTGSAGAMRDLHIDTWLHHGDRAQYIYAWSGSAYVMKSRGRDIIEGGR